MKKELLSHKKIMVNFITIIILIILNLENLSKAYSFEDTNLKKSIIFESINESSKCNNIIQNDTIKYPSTNNFSVEYFYLYIYPPFPQPARNMMRALIYWDINLKMDVSNITLYDINGVRVETGGNLTLDEICCVYHEAS